MPSISHPRHRTPVKRDQGTDLLCSSKLLLLRLYLVTGSAAALVTLADVPFTNLQRSALVRQSLLAILQSANEVLLQLLQLLHPPDSAVGSCRRLCVTATRWRAADIPGSSIARGNRRCSCCQLRLKTQATPRQV